MPSGHFGSLIKTKFLDSGGAGEGQRYNYPPTRAIPPQKKKMAWNGCQTHIFVVLSVFSALHTISPPLRLAMAICFSLSFSEVWHILWVKNLALTGFAIFGASRNFLFLCISRIYYFFKLTLFLWPSFLRHTYFQLSVHLFPVGLSSYTISNSSFFLLSLPNAKNKWHFPPSPPASRSSLLRQRKTATRAESRRPRATAEWATPSIPSCRWAPNARWFPEEEAIIAQRQQQQWPLSGTATRCGTFSWLSA